MSEANEPKKTALAQASQDAMVVDTMGGRVHVRWDETAQAAAAKAKLDAIAEELAGYDWSYIAVPEFEESSAWFHPDAERLKTIPLELHAYDSANDLVIWRGQGWELPKETRTVYRFPVLYFVTDPAGERLTEAFITIEGYTEE